MNRMWGLALRCRLKRLPDRLVDGCMLDRPVSAAIVVLNRLEKLPSMIRQPGNRLEVDEDFVFDLGTEGRAHRLAVGLRRWLNNWVKSKEMD